MPVGLAPCDVANATACLVVHADLNIYCRFDRLVSFFPGFFIRYRRRLEIFEMHNVCDVLASSHFIHISIKKKTFLVISSVAISAENFHAGLSVNTRPCHLEIKNSYLRIRRPELYYWGLLPEKCRINDFAWAKDGGRATKTCAYSRRRAIGPWRRDRDRIATLPLYIEYLEELARPMVALVPTVLSVDLPYDKDVR